MSDKGYKYRYATWQENGRQKGDCVGCGHKSFVYLVYADTGKIVGAEYGKCERIFKCGYRKYKTGTGTVLASYLQQNNSINTNPDTIYKSIKDDSLDGWTTNNLVLFLWRHTKADYNVIADRIYQYGIGTSKHTYYKNGCIYWQTDINGDIRTGKIIQYDEATGKRVKTLTPPVKWFHHFLKKKDYNMIQCLFGEHLLGMNKSMPVAIVESEKTAFIMSIFWNEYIWIATGGQENLNERAKNVLMGRDVTVFPDIDAEEKWFKIADAFGWKFQSVRKMMDAVGYNYKEGDDIADLTVWKKRK